MLAHINVWFQKLSKCNFALQHFLDTLKYGDIGKKKAECPKITLSNLGPRKIRRKEELHTLGGRFDLILKKNNNCISARETRVREVLFNLFKMNGFLATKFTFFWWNRWALLFWCRKCRQWLSCYHSNNETKRIQHSQKSNFWCYCELLLLEVNRKQDLLFYVSKYCDFI